MKRAKKQDWSSKPVKCSACTSASFRGDEGRVRYHFVLLDFLCRAIGGELKAGSDAADVRWFSREELPALNLAHDANDVVLKGLARHCE